ncbi:MAG TPA: bacillithiol biosynthesis BshC [Gemmatimonadaceae bacterium]|nr:bacillithiol biosynthesis BshC [Gemmatimonadaceae bacterium]
MSELHVLTRPLGGSPLARDAVREQTPAAWYRSRPLGRDAWVTYATGVRDSFAGRDWLEPLRAAIDAGGAAAERLARSAGGAGLVVTTGQQPGLFGGPLYTWSKALSALALADELEAVTGMPVAPVFWAATDDTDFAEASVTHVAVPGGVESLAQSPPAVTGASMRDTPLSDVSPLLAQLQHGAGSAADADVWRMVRDAYEPMETIGGAYVRLLRSLLEPLGIAVLDAGHPSVRQAWRPLVARALDRAADVDRALRARADAIQQAGYTAQVAQVPGLSLVHETVRGARRRVPLDSAAARAADAHADLGPNVLLRPVVERGILPTAAYLAGPGELAYFAQVGAVADALESPVPLALPRWSGLVVEPHIERVLQRRSLSVDELRDPHAAETRLVRERLPVAVRTAMDEWRARVDASAAALRQALNHDGGEPLVGERVVAGAERDMRHRLDRLERRAVAAVKRRERELLLDVATARGALWPLGKPQERMLNVLPLLARHGMRVFDLMLERAREHAAALVSAGIAHALAAPDPADGRR